jgi:predicted S18 family serine protease
MQRIVNNSYINLKLFDNYIPNVNDINIKGEEAKKELKKKLVVLIKEHGKTMENAFYERCELLEGWARCQSIQQRFRAEIKLIEEYLEIKISTGTLTLAYLEFYFGSVIKIVRSFEHTRALLKKDKNASFYFDLSLTSIENATRITRGCAKVDCNMSKKELQLVTYTLIREAQFCLIRKASKINDLPVINSWHTKYSGTNLNFDD